MKILVTGGAGFIGSHVADLFLKEGHEVVVLDNLSSGSIHNLHSDVRFYHLDIRSSDVLQVFQEEKPDVVSHHAAHVNLRQSLDDPIYDGDVNILGSLNLLEIAVKSEVKHFIYASSGGAVYGEPEHLPCVETHPTKPISPYGASKHIVELHLSMYQANYGLPFTILRYPNIYGPRQDPSGEAGIVAIFTELMLAGKQIEIFGDGEQVRDFLYVMDCARANLLALNTQSWNEIFNLGSGEGTSVNEIYSKLNVITKNNMVPLRSPKKLGEIRRIVLDTNKAHRLLKWKPIVPLKLGLEKTVEYFRNSVKESRLRTAPSIESEIIQREQKSILLPKQYDLEKERSRGIDRADFDLSTDRATVSSD